MKRGTSFLVLLIILVVTVPATPASASSLWGQWILDPAHVSGQTLAAVRGMSGAAAGVVGWDDEPEGRWYRFDGASNHIICYSGAPENLALPTANITVEAWVKVDSYADYQGFAGYVQDNFSYERGWWLGTYGRKFTFVVSSAGKNYLTWLSAGAQYEIGRWYHVVGVYNGSVMQIYIDGKLAGETNDQRGDILYPEKGVLALGAYVDDNELITLKGSLREVRIYSQALTAGEVAASQPGLPGPAIQESNIFGELDDLLKITGLGINNHEKAAAFENIYSNYGNDADFVREFFSYCADDLDKYYWLGIYLYSEGYTNIRHYDLALATLNLGLKLSQDHEEVRFYYVIGNLYWQWDKKELGRPYFEKALELADKYPGNIPATSQETRDAINAYYGFD